MVRYLIVQDKYWTPSQNLNAMLAKYQAKGLTFCARVKLTTERCHHIYI
jgi:hypothetical protein